MVKILRHGLQNSKPIRRFRCIFCYCKFKTDEYGYTSHPNKGTILTIDCPECKQSFFITYKAGLMRVIGCGIGVLAEML